MSGRFPPEALGRKLLLTVISGPSRSGDPIDTIREASEGGATTIQLRCKAATSRELVSFGERVRVVTAEAGVLLIVNDRTDVALAINADGAHLGDDDIPLEAARNIVPPDFILGRSVDNADQARAAAAAGADYVGLGPIFPSRSKSDTGPVVGVDGIAEVVAAAGIPLVAIGGIDETTAADVVRAGAHGIAVIAAVAGAANPRAATARLRREVERGARER